MNAAFGLFAILGAAIWFALVGRAGATEWIFGAPVVLSAWWLLHRTAEFDMRLSPPEAWRLLRGVGAYMLFHVAPEIVMSTAQVFTKVLQPHLDVKPAILAIRVPEATRAGLLVLAYGISLAPGQLIVAIDEGRNILYVHNFDAPDPAAVEAAILATFDRYLKEAFPC